MPPCWWPGRTHHEPPGRSQGEYRSAAARRIPMSRTLAHVAIDQAADIVAARQHARRLAELLGYDRQAQTRIATAVSEIVRNAYYHGKGGEVEFSVDAALAPEHLWVRVSDRSPGFTDLEATLSGRTEPGAVRGSGLVHARRLVDRFEVESRPGGAVVRLGQRIPRSVAARITTSTLEAIGAQLRGARGADPVVAMQEQNRELIESLADLQ